MPADLPPSRIPLTIVCGAPGSGKTTHVLLHALPGDLVIDLDQIVQEISGRHGHQASGAVIGEALERRNALLRGLAANTTHARAWFVVCAAEPQEREHWSRMLGGTIEVIATPPDECIRRIKADPGRRQRRAHMIAGAQAWWASNPQLR